MRGNLDYKTVDGKYSRGSGRTYAQLESCQKGDIFIVQNRMMISYCKGLLGVMGRPPDFVEFRTAESIDYDLLQGTSRWIEVDHCIRLTPPQLDFLQYRNGRYLSEHPAEETFNKQNQPTLQ